MMKLLLLVCLVVSSVRGDIEVVPEEPTAKVMYNKMYNKINKRIGVRYSTCTTRSTGGV